MSNSIISLNHEALKFIKSFEEVSYEDKDIPTPIGFKNSMTKFEGFKPRLWRQDDIYWWEVLDHVIIKDGEYILFTALRPYIHGEREVVHNYFSWSKNLNLPENRIDYDRGQFNKESRICKK